MLDMTIATRGTPVFGTSVIIVLGSLSVSLALHSDCHKVCRNGGILDTESCMCECVNGYHGDLCKRLPCLTECVNGSVNQTNCRCQCDPGWSGPKCDCDLQCDNGGILYSRYCRCRCVDGFRGPSCSEPPCNSSLCINGVQNPFTCDCRCSHGWAGSKCDCYRHCRNGGVLNEKTCKCACVDGYRGDLCGLPPCEKDCLNGALYQKTCDCQCLEGWIGRHCDCPMCRNNGTFYQMASGECRCLCENGYRGATCSLPPCDVPCNHGWVDENCQCNCYLGWSGTQCSCDSVCDNSGVLNVTDCSCTCTGGFTGTTCRTCHTRCTEPAVLCPGSCLCKVPAPCDVPCPEGLRLYSRTCVCTPSWVNCDQFDAANCRSVVEGGYCMSRSNQASCPQACGLCVARYFPNETLESTSMAKGILSIDGIFHRECGPAPEIEHAVVTYHGHNFLSVAEYTCNEGYAAHSGVPLTQCQEDSTWLPVNFVCAAASPAIHKRSVSGCGSPPRMNDTIVTFTSTSIGSVAEYSCLSGYEASGSGRATCQINELWSIPPLLCKECPVCENNGQFFQIVTGECRCLCKNGYRGPTCSLPPCDVPCDHGWVDKNCHCNCYLGWSGTQCSCDRVCDNSGILNVTDCSCTCTGGFTGTTCRTCLARCTERLVLCPASCQCKEPPPCNTTCPEGLGLYSGTCVCTPSWVNCRQFDAANCRLVLDGGYCMSRSNQASCPQSCGVCLDHHLPNKTRESTSMAKDILSVDGIFHRECGPAPDLENAEVFDHNITFLSVAQYACNEGYVAHSGVPLTQCQEDGTWLPMDVTCVASPAIHKRSISGCGSPPRVNGMEVEFTSTSIGSVAEYSCLSGYEASGSGRATCQINELWSIPSLLCEENTASWLLIARTSQSVTPVEDMKALVGVLENSCVPILAVQATSGSETTLYYTSAVGGSDADVMGQSSLRMSKQSWNTFAPSPSHEFHTFRTNGQTSVLAVNKGETTQTSSSKADLEWWHKYDSCLKLLSSVIDSSDISAAGVFRADILYDNGWTTASKNSEFPSLIVPKDTPQRCIDTCWYSVTNEKEIVEGVAKGQNLVVKIDNTQAPAQDVIVYNDHVTATIGQWASSESQVWRAVQFDGTLSECKHSQNGISFTKKQERPSWLLDSRPWNKVLSINGNGTILHGSKSALIDSISSSKTLRLGVLHSNNIRHYMSVGTVVWQERNEAAAEVVNHPCVERDWDSRVGLSSTCPTWAAIITTEGQYNVYEYSKHDGRHKAVTDVVTIDWFVQ